MKVDYSVLQIPLLCSSSRPGAAGRVPRAAGCKPLIPFAISSLALDFLSPEARPLNLKKKKKERKVKVKDLAAQTFPTLCNPMDCCSSVHGLLQARILEGVAIPLCRRSSRPRN